MIWIFCFFVGIINHCCEIYCSFCRKIYNAEKSKGGETMNKKITEKMFSGVKAVAESSLKRDAKTTTCFGIYQPKAPAALKAFAEKKR